MPIAGSYYEPAPAPARDGLDSLRDFLDTEPSLAERFADLIEHRFDYFRTAEDERVCPVCGPLDFTVWEYPYGPFPPLHNHCRCWREVAYVELGSR